MDKSAVRNIRKSLHIHSAGIANQVGQAANQLRIVSCVLFKPLCQLLVTVKYRRHANVAVIKHQVRQVCSVS